MARYLLRALRQVAVYELTGKEEVVEAETEAQVHLRAREFMVREFPEHAPDIEIEIKPVGSEPVTSKTPEDFKPLNKSKFNPGAPF